MPLESPKLKESRNLAVYKLSLHRVINFIYDKLFCSKWSEITINPVSLACGLKLILWCTNLVRLRFQIRVVGWKFSFPPLVVYRSLPLLSCLYETNKTFLLGILVGESVLSVQTMINNYVKWTKFWALNHFNSDTFMCAPLDGVARGLIRLLIVLKEILLFFL